MPEPTEDISAPVLSERSQQKSSWFVRIAIVIVLLVCAMAALSLLMGQLFARDKAKWLKRSESVRVLSEAVARYEQTHRIAMTELPDWKGALIDGEYITEETIESREAVNGKINYILLSRPTDQFKAGQPLWVAVYEDPQSMKSPYKQILYIFQGMSYALASNPAELSERVRQKCLEVKVSYDPATSRLRVPVKPTSEPANSK